MELDFRTSKLRRCYGEQRMAARTWGPVVGQKYIERITVIKAAQKFSDLFALVFLGLHPLTGDRRGQHSMTIHRKWRLIVTVSESEDSLVAEEVSDHYGD